MKKQLLTLLVVCLGLCIAPSIYGDSIPTKGKWGKHYRSVLPAPPVLSIEGNILSVDFVDPVQGLTVRITNEQGEIVYEDQISGDRGECVPIVLNFDSPGRFYVQLEHPLGWLLGEFII